MRRKPSLRDVADAAGVHVSTVSRALNAETARLLSPEVAERVRAVAEGMGYCPNAMAAALRTARSGAVGLVVPDMTHPAFPAILRGAEAVLGPAGYVLLVMSVEHDFRRAPALLRQMRSRQLDGMIVATAQADDPFIAAALADDRPMVAINAAGPAGAYPSVIVDEAQGMTAVMEYLHDLGHRCIAHLAGPSVTRTGRARQQAFLDHGGRADMVAAAAAYDRPGAHAACHDLLDRFPPGSRGGVTAIVAGNDLLALGCLDVFAARGLHCPDDVSLTGFMDLPNMDLISPALTTVRVNLGGMGEQAARLLLRRMASESEDGGCVVLPVELVVRQSCRSV